MDNEKIAKILGSRGGLKTKEKYGSDHYREMQKKGVENRRKKKLALNDIKRST